MIVLENPEKYAEYQEVDGLNLALLTSNGWVIVALLTADVTDMQSSSKPYTGSDGYQQTSYVEETFVLKQPRYLVGKTRDKVLEELRESEREAVQEAKNHQADATVFKGQVEGKEKTIAAKQREADQQHERIQGLQEKANEARSMQQKMEGDLAKVRQAVGDIKFKEIIGPAKQDEQR
jgi:hypothetical protein